MNRAYHWWLRRRVRLWLRATQLAGRVEQFAERRLRHAYDVLAAHD
jgi:hypothetical protein